MDWIVHLSLGLAALAAVVCALGATFDFCGHLNQIAGEFNDSSALVAAPDEARKSALTNAAGVDGSVLDPVQPGRTNPPSVAPAACRESPLSG
jgi:hypothetical protein